MNPFHRSMAVPLGALVAVLGLGGLGLGARAVSSMKTGSPEAPAGSAPACPLPRPAGSGTEEAAMSAQDSPQTLYAGLVPGPDPRVAPHGVPPLDAAAPAITERARFALG